MALIDGGSPLMAGPTCECAQGWEHAVTSASLTALPVQQLRRRLAVHRLGRDQRVCAATMASE
jgi:hypothetical protein